MYIMYVCHPATAMCEKGAESKLRRRVKEDAQEVAAATFQAYGSPLTVVSPFKYLGSVFTASEN